MVRVNKIMKKNYKIYSPFAISVFKTKMVYKFSFCFEIISKTFEIFITFCLWKAVFTCSNSERIAGFSFDDMVTYIFISFVVSNLIYVDVANTIGGDVVEGTLAVSLIKPIDYRVKLFVTSIGMVLYRLIVPSFFIWLGIEAYRCFVLNIGVTSITQIIFFIISCFFSFIIYFLLDFCFGMLSFYSSYVWGMVMIKNAILCFLSGQLIPISFYPKCIQKVFSFLPFSSMNYTPVMIYLGKIRNINMINAFGIQIAWIIVLYIISSLIWKNAVNKVMIIGG